MLKSFCFIFIAKVYDKCNNLLTCVIYIDNMFKNNQALKLFLLNQAHSFKTTYQL